jgi:hypothetical protein
MIDSAFLHKSDMHKRRNQEVILFHGVMECGVMECGAMECGAME